MTLKVNLNADMAEGFGAYDIGNDTELLNVIKSANIACGFHAGDPSVMHRVILQAKEKGVSIGCHPGFNDLWGFGRRPMDMRPDDLEYAVAYQIGALQGMAAYVGEKVTHLKPHGALNNIAAEDADAAMAIGRAIKTVDADIIYVALSGTEMERAAEKLNLPIAREGFPDRMYDDHGNLASRKIAGTVISDPEIAKQRAVRMVAEQEIISINGKKLDLKVESLCIHGDEPTSFLVAQAVKQGLEDAGIEVVTLPEMNIS